MGIFVALLGVFAMKNNMNAANTAENMPWAATYAGKTALKSDQTATGNDQTAMDKDKTAEEGE